MNLTKSQQIKAGIQQKYVTGTSGKASTTCYGYRVTTDGALLPYPSEAIIVFHIFERFANGDSLGKISASLQRLGAKSPTGKETWSRETISKLLDNEKYLGHVALGKTEVEDGVQVKTDAHAVVLKDHHEPIISEELFQMVQLQKKKRSKAKVR